LEIEHELILNGTHPEYNQRRLEYEQARDQEILLAKRRLSLTKETAHKTKDCTIKLANDTFIVIFELTV
jgi:glutamine amidotransferase-like uncharacterized protein